jgi:N-terminal domain of anti-restriction factor ArdC
MEATLNLAVGHSQHNLVHSSKADARREALMRAVSGQTMSNYPAIYQGFMARGIPESEIKPRENVFTFEAWKALGRYVRKGEHGVKVVTFIETKSKEIDQDTGEAKIIRRPWTTTVFHISQTEAMNGGVK